MRSDREKVMHWLDMNCYLDKKNRIRSLFYKDRTNFNVTFIITKALNKDIGDYYTVVCGPDGDGTYEPNDNCEDINELMDEWVLQKIGME